MVSFNFSTLIIPAHNRYKLIMESFIRNGNLWKICYSTNEYTYWTISVVKVGGGGVLSWLDIAKRLPSLISRASHEHLEIRLILIGILKSEFFKSYLFKIVMNSRKSIFSLKSLEKCSRIFHRWMWELPILEFIHFSLNQSGGSWVLISPRCKKRNLPGVRIFFSLHFSCN